MTRWQDIPLIGGGGLPITGRVRRLAGLWLAATFLVAIVGPFGTYDAMSLPRRALYWGIVAGGGLLAGMAIREQLSRRLAPRAPALDVIVHAGAVTALLGPAIWLVSLLFAPADGPAPPGLARMLALVFVVSIGIGVLRLVIASLTAGAAAPEPPTREAEPRLLRRLPADRRGRLLRCEVSGHHTVIVTEAGQATLRLRFADAISELDEADGLRVHRSHWVAREAVHGHDNVNGRLFLTLADGARVPVSRNYRRAVEASGLVTSHR